jgi:holo-[acyl-carrier protein] synthase
MPLRVGIDLVHVPTIAEAIAEHGQRYLERVYTSQEVADCTRDGDAAVPWPSIEVVRHPGAAPTLELHSPAADMAEKAGITALALSFSHEDAYATAIVVAT